MNTNKFQSTGLPIKHNLKPIYILSIIIIILVLTASLIGILTPTLIYPTADLLESFIANDIINLLIALPIMITSLWLTKKDRLMGLLFWPGALFFVLYSSLVYIFALPLNPALLLHLSIVTFSMYTLTGLLSSIHGKEVQQQLTGSVPEKTAGGILSALGFLFLMRIILQIISSIITKTAIPNTELALHIADFLITPAWIFGGIMLWRGKEIGYVIGLGLLYQASMLFVGLIVFLIIQPLLTTAPFVLSDIVVIFILGMVCFIPFGLFIRGILSTPR